MLKRLPDEGQKGGADNGQKVFANARQPHGDDEATRLMPQGPSVDASPSSELGLVRQAAREVVETNGLDAPKAYDALVTKAESNDALRYQLIRAGARYAVDKAIVEMRERSWSPDVAIRTARQVAISRDTPERVVTLAASNLLTFPLPNGRLLKDANRSEVQAAADGYRAREVDARVKRDWLDLIVKGLPEPDSKVSDFYDLKKLQELKQKALRDAA